MQEIKSVVFIKGEYTDKRDKEVTGELSRSFDKLTLTDEETDLVQNRQPIPLGTLLLNRLVCLTILKVSGLSVDEMGVGKLSMSEFLSKINSTVMNFIMGLPNDGPNSGSSIDLQLLFNSMQQTHERAEICLSALNAFLLGLMRPSTFVGKRLRPNTTQKIPCNVFLANQ
ncbi:hypothetical protein LSTR_LSTR012227 [Laodelphax striatellus]|uniref:Uncharacterized protein n=1 Tax=Laodelphax striatellus TaxID=195883 RepID=A0A482XH08_LAOST|nr:hypothetical protein LSTR_LSTR012227 [Laodelphax striatellus]